MQSPSHAVEGQFKSMPDPVEDLLNQSPYINKTMPEQAQRHFQPCPYHFKRFHDDSVDKFEYLPDCMCQVNNTAPKDP